MIIFHHPARARIKRTKCIYRKNFYFIHTYMKIPCHKIDQILFFPKLQYNYPLQKIQFLFLSKCFSPKYVFKMKSAFWVISNLSTVIPRKMNFGIFYIKRISLLLIEYNLCSSLDLLVSLR